MGTIGVPPSMLYRRIFGLPGHFVVIVLAVWVGLSVYELMFWPYVAGDNSSIWHVWRMFGLKLRFNIYPAVFAAVGYFLVNYVVGLSFVLLGRVLGLPKP